MRLLSCCHLLFSLLLLLHRKYRIGSHRAYVTYWPSRHVTRDLSIWAAFFLKELHLFSSFRLIHSCAVSMRHYYLIYRGIVTSREELNMT